MAQKLVMGGLAAAIIAVIGFGLIDAGQVPSAEVIEEPASTFDERAIIPDEETLYQGSEMPQMPQEAQPQPVVRAQGAMGDTWQTEGTISQLDEFGMTLRTADGDFYVELGPPTYWQAQDVVLNEGDTISVDGYNNGEQVHARIVTTNNAELVLRDESGKPMWAGSNTEGTTSQVTSDDWLTLSGAIDSVTNSSVNLSTDEGELLNLQMGRPDFWQSQGITLEAGDLVEVLGFWSGERFMVGDIRKVETGETIMLRDPNGRQLWSGPGRNGNGGGQGSGGNGQGSGQSGQGNGGNGQSSGQSGQSNRGNGQGNGNRPTATP